MSWNEILENYIYKNSNKLKAATEPLKKHYGINYVTYHRIEKDGRYSVLVNRSDWASHYVSEKLYAQDPYLRQLSQYKSGTISIDQHGSKEYQEKIMNAGEKILHSNELIITIRKECDFVEFFGFSSDKRNNSVLNFFLDPSKPCLSFQKYFLQTFQSPLQNMQEEGFFLSKLKGEDFFQSEKISPPNSFQFLTDLGSNRQKFTTLSNREQECLQLFQQGHTASETAHILKLSPRTVESYFENIKTKLHCHTKKDLLNF